MKKNLKKVVLVLALLLPGVIKAQEFNVTAKADFVSDYIWRGAYQNSGFSVQPTLGLSYGNLSLSAWGSQSLTKTDGAQEFDINLSYTIGGLGITSKFHVCHASTLSAYHWPSLPLYQKNGDIPALHEA